MPAAKFVALVRSSGAHPDLLRETLQSLELQAEPCESIVLRPDDTIANALDRLPGAEFLFFLEEGRIVYPFFTSSIQAAFAATGADIVGASDCNVMRLALRDSFPQHREPLMLYPLPMTLCE